MRDSQQPQLPQDIPDKIHEFTGTFAFLSNAYPASVWVDGLRYPTVTHAYQAAKTNDPEKKRAIREAKTPREATKLGRAAARTEGRVIDGCAVMTELVKKKFESPILRSMLLATGESLLANCGGKSSSDDWLGKIIMQVREQIKHEE